MIVGPVAQSEGADRRHGTYHALESHAVLGAGHGASEVSGLDAGWLQVDDQPAAGRRYRAGLQAGKFNTVVCQRWSKRNSVVDETPLEKEEHSYFRTQVGRLSFLSLGPDLEYAVGQLARHASAPTVSDHIAPKSLIRFLSTTRNMTLDLFSKGRLVLTAVADADWAGVARRR